MLLVGVVVWMISHVVDCRNKKKKIPLHSGEEVDMDLSLTEYVYLFVYLSVST